ncbi:MAG TPA: glycoside hydrolase family 76 protein, partial [Solirubrobacteraceae bacterium]|nr:glycoside hydrolase family 76 protein [Solirubrobacteraceae bacterium]
ELQRAEQIFTLEVSGWSADSSLPCPGGIPFTDDTSYADRNTITNAPGAELAVLLYRLTNDHTYLEWAKRMYQWVRQCLSLGTGLYADHITDGGSVDTTTWTYTQGVMIGAGVMLYKATGDQSYLDQARDTEQATLSYFDPASFIDEPPFFVSVVFRNLLLFNSVSPNPVIPEMVKGYADWAWNTQRRKNGLYSFSTDETNLLSQAAVINAYAMLVEPIDSFY